MRSLSYALVLVALSGCPTPPSTPEPRRTDEQPPGGRGEASSSGATNEVSADPHQLEINCWYEVRTPTGLVLGKVFVSPDPTLGGGSGIEHWVLPGWGILNGLPSSPPTFSLYRKDCEQRTLEWFVKTHWEPGAVTFEAVSHPWGPVRDKDEALVGGQGSPMTIRGCHLHDGTTTATWGYYRCDYLVGTDIKTKVERMKPTSVTGTAVGCNLKPGGTAQTVTFPGYNLSCPAGGSRWFELRAMRSAPPRPVGVVNIPLKD